MSKFTHARQHFPNLHILACARDVQHIDDLRKPGAHSVQRELFESSLLIGRSALEHLGHGRYEAKELADTFRRSNNELLERMAGLRDKTPAKEFVKAARAGREELERQLQAEAKLPQQNYEWQAAKARAAAEKS